MDKFNKCNEHGKAFGHSGLEVLNNQKQILAFKKVLVSQEGPLKSKINPHENGLFPYWVVLPICVLFRNILYIIKSVFL